MIDEQAALAEAERQGIRVSDEELAQQIFAIPGLQENGRFIGEARYEQLLRSQRPPMTKSRFRGEPPAQHDDRQAARRADRLDGGRRTGARARVQAAQREGRSSRSWRSPPTASAIRSPSPTRMSTAYFDPRKAEYRIGEQRKVKMLLLDRDAGAREGERSRRPKPRRYYNEQHPAVPDARAGARQPHPAEYRRQGRSDRAQAGRGDPASGRKAGADFAALAKKFSEDEGSKVKGGDLDYFARGRMVPEFETAAFDAATRARSAISSRSQFGFHIIKVVDKRPGATTPLDEVRAQIQDTLAWQSVDQQIGAQSATARGPDQQPGGPRHGGPRDRADGRGVGLLPARRPDPGPRRGAAGLGGRVHDGGQRRERRAHHPARPGVHHRVGKHDPYVPKLDEVKDRVREDLIRSRATELSRQRAGQIAAALKAAGGNFAAAAKAQGLEAKDTELVARESALPDIGVSPEVDKVAFNLPAGGVSEPITTNDGTVIVRVVERDEVTPGRVQPAKETFRAELLNERRNRFFTAYMTKGEGADERSRSTTTSSETHVPASAIRVDSAVAPAALASRRQTASAPAARRGGTAARARSAPRWRAARLRTPATQAFSAEPAAELLASAPRRCCAAADTHQLDILVGRNAGALLGDARPPRRARRARPRGRARAPAARSTRALRHGVDPLGRRLARLGRLLDEVLVEALHVVLHLRPLRRARTARTASRCRRSRPPSPSRSPTPSFSSVPPTRSCPCRRRSSRSACAGCATMTCAGIAM